MKNKFSAIALDQLIKDCTGQVDEISSELSTYDSSDVISAGNPVSSNLINSSGVSVDFNRVYNQLERLMQNGNNALQLLASLQPDTIEAGTMAATASLMNAIKNCISQFTKIHSIHIKHQLALQLQKQRQQNKKQLILLKQDMKNSKQAINNDNIPLQQFSDKTTQDIFRYLLQQKKNGE